MLLAWRPLCLQHFDLCYAARVYVCGCLVCTRQLNGRILHTGAFEGCSFYNNTAHDGAAVMLSNSAGDGVVNFNDCHFEGNTAYLRGASPSPPHSPTCPRILRPPARHPASLDGKQLVLTHACTSDPNHSVLVFVPTGEYARMPGSAA